MKIMNEIAVCSMLAFSLIGMSQVALAEKRDLTKDEIIVMFSDKTVWGNHARRNKRNKVYYAPDGTFKYKRLDEISAGEGKWHVDDENRLCMVKEGNTWCRRVVDKNGKIKKYKGKKHVWNFTKFADGNKL